MENIKKKRHHCALETVYVSLGILLLGMGSYHIARGEWEALIKLFLLSSVFFIPMLAALAFRVTLTDEMKICGAVFVFCACILGEAYEFYLRYPLWDDILHFLSGLLFCAFACALVKGKAQGLFAFCFSLSVSTVWEFLEFFADLLLGTDMQKDTVVKGMVDIGLYDTMTDLLAGALGAGFFLFWLLDDYKKGMSRAERLIPKNK
jgi:hypothetical protein